MPSNNNSPRAFPSSDDIFTRQSSLPHKNRTKAKKRADRPFFLWGSENEFAMLIAGKRLAKDADWALAQFLQLARQGIGGSRPCLCTRATTVQRASCSQAPKKSKDEKQLVMPMTLRGSALSDIGSIGTTKETRLQSMPRCPTEEKTTSVVKMQYRPLSPPATAAGRIPSGSSKFPKQN